MKYYGMIQEWIYYIDESFDNYDYELEKDFEINIIYCFSENEMGNMRLNPENLENVKVLRERTRELRGNFTINIEKDLNKYNISITKN